MTDNLRDRITAAIAKADQDWCSDNPVHEDLADAVIRELDMGIPCAANGCRMRQIARRHAEASSRLEQPYCNRCGIPHASACKRPADA